MREDVIGRANVEDTPELDRYYQELGRQESYALWTVANSIEPWQPQPTSLPQMWSYKAMRPLVLQGARPRQPREGRPPRHRAGESRPQGHLGLRRLALHRLAGDEARRVRDRAQSCVVGAALRRSKARAPTRWSTATRWISPPAISSSRRTAPGTITASKPTARRRSGRTASTCCWSTSSTPISTPCIPSACRSRTIRSTTPRRCTAGRACCRPAAKPGASRTRRCSSTNGAAPTRR